MVSEVVLLYEVLRTSILTERGVASLGLQAHRSEEAAGAAAGVTAAVAEPGVGAKNDAGVRDMVEPGAGPGAGPNSPGAAPVCPADDGLLPRVVPSRVASLPGVNTEVPSGA